MTIWKYGPKRKLLLLIFLDIFTGLGNLFTALVSSNLIKAALDRSMQIFISTAGWAVIGFTIIAAFNYWQVNVKNDYIRQTNLKIKRRLIANVISNSASTQASGDTVSLFMNDLKLLETNGIVQEVSLVEQVIVVIFAVIGGAYFDFLTTLVFAVGSLIPTLASHRLRKPIAERSAAWTESNKQFTGSLKDVLLSLDTIRNYSAQQIIGQRVSDQAGDVETSLYKMNSTSGHVNVLTMLIALIFAFVLPFSFGVYRIVIGAITLPAFMGVVQISNYIVNPLLKGLSAYSQLNTARPIRAQVDQLYDMPQPADEAGLESVTPDFQGLQLQDAAIMQGDHQVFSNFSLAVQPGEKLLIKGPSGSGKSTLLRALDGEIQLQSGAYQLNGQPASQLSTNLLSSTFGYIRQKPILFNDDIRFNLTLGRHFDEEKILAAANEAGLSTLLQEKGLDYQIGEDGNRLSGGQGQRIEIARAFLYGFPVLLADEVTSSLDEALSAKIHEVLLQSDKTVIEVAHHMDQDLAARFDSLVELD